MARGRLAVCSLAFRLSYYLDWFDQSRICSFFYVAGPVFIFSRTGDWFHQSGSSIVPVNGMTRPPSAEKLLVRRLTSGGHSTLSVWNSNSSPTSPLMSFDVSGVANPAPNASNLFIGNSQQRLNPFTDTISAFVYYNSGLSDSNASTAQTAVEDQMFCSARKVALPSVTANH